MKMERRRLMGARSLPVVLALATIFLVSASAVFAQGMMGSQSERSFGSTASNTPSDQEGQSGLQLWRQLQSKQISCNQLTEGNFDDLGDYFMGQMVGSAHESADKMMTQRFGEEGARQMHVAMGERLSGCDVNASVPDGGDNFLSMMTGGGRNNGDWGSEGSLPARSGLPAGIDGLPNFLVWPLWLAGIADLALLGVILSRRIRN